MPLLDMTLDPDVMQFRQGKDKLSGITGRLNVDKWSSTSAGNFVAWQSENGEIFLVDGHHRYQAAKSLDQNPLVQVQLLRESDGWTAEQAKQQAAIKNVTEGHAIEIDTAIAIRGASAEERQRMDKIVNKNAYWKVGRGLAKLDDKVFRAVIGNPDFTPRQGGIIGDIVSDTEKQWVAMQTILEVKPENESQERLVVEGVNNAQIREGETDLFGERSYSDYATKIRLLDSARKQVSKSKSIASFLARNEAKAEKIGDTKVDKPEAEKRRDMLSAMEYVIRDALNAGTNAAKVANDLVEGMGGQPSNMAVSKAAGSFISQTMTDDVLGQLYKEASKTSPENNLFTPKGITDEKASHVTLDTERPLSESSAEKMNSVVSFVNKLIKEYGFEGNGTFGKGEILVLTDFITGMERTTSPAAAYGDIDTIYISRKLLDSQNIGRVLQAVAHEFGHMAYDEFVQKLSDAEKTTLQEGYEKWAAEQKNRIDDGDYETALDLLNIGTPRGAALAIQSLTKKEGNFDWIYARHQADRWVKDMEEFAANQIALLETNPDNFPEGTLKKIFRKMADALKKFWNILRKSELYQAEPTFQEFLKNYKESVKQREEGIIKAEKEQRDIQTKAGFRGITEEVSENPEVIQQTIDEGIREAVNKANENVRSKTAKEIYAHGTSNQLRKALKDNNLITKKGIKDVSWVKRWFAPLAGRYSRGVSDKLASTYIQYNKDVSGWQSGASTLGKLFSAIVKSDIQTMREVSSIAEQERIDRGWSDKQALDRLKMKGLERETMWFQNIFNKVRERYNAGRREIKRGQERLLREELVPEIAKQTIAKIATNKMVVANEDTRQITERLLHEIVDNIYELATNETIVRDEKGAETGLAPSALNDKEIIDSMVRIGELLEGLHNDSVNALKEGEEIKNSWQDIQVMIEDMVMKANEYTQGFMKRRDFYFPHVFRGSHSVKAFGAIAATNLAKLQPIREMMNEFDMSLDDAVNTIIRDNGGVMENVDADTNAMVGAHPTQNKALYLRNPILNAEGNIASVQIGRLVPHKETGFYKNYGQAKQVADEFNANKSAMKAEIHDVSNRADVKGFRAVLSDTHIAEIEKDSGLPDTVITDMLFGDKAVIRRIPARVAWGRARKRHGFEGWIKDPQVAVDAFVREHFSHQKRQGYRTATRPLMQVAIHFQKSGGETLFPQLEGMIQQDAKKVFNQREGVAENFIDKTYRKLEEASVDFLADKLPQEWKQYAYLSPPFLASAAAGGASGAIMGGMVFSGATAAAPIAGGIAASIVPLMLARAAYRAGKHGGARQWREFQRTLAMYSAALRIGTNVKSMINNSYALAIAATNLGRGGEKYVVKGLKRAAIASTLGRSIYNRMQGKEGLQNKTADELIKMDWSELANEAGYTKGNVSQQALDDWVHLINDTPVFNQGIQQFDIPTSDAVVPPERLASGLMALFSISEYANRSATWFAAEMVANDKGLKGFERREFIQNAFDESVFSGGEFKTAATNKFVLVGQFKNVVLRMLNEQQGAIFGTHPAIRRAGGKHTKEGKMVMRKKITYTLLAAGLSGLVPITILNAIWKGLTGDDLEDELQAEIFQAQQSGEWSNEFANLASGIVSGYGSIGFRTLNRRDLEGSGLLMPVAGTLAWDIAKAARGGQSEGQVLSKGIMGQIGKTFEFLEKNLPKGMTLGDAFGNPGTAFDGFGEGLGDGLPTRDYKGRISGKTSFTEGVRDWVSLNNYFLPYPVLDRSPLHHCLLYTSPSPRDRQKSRMPSSA